MMERSRIQRIEKDLLSLKAGKNNETVQNQSEGKAREARKPLSWIILEGKTETRTDTREEMRGSKYLNFEEKEATSRQRRLTMNPWRRRGGRAKRCQD